MDGVGYSPALRGHRKPLVDEYGLEYAILRVRFWHQCRAQLEEGITRSQVHVEAKIGL